MTRNDGVTKSKCLLNCSSHVKQRYPAIQDATNGRKVCAFGANSSELFFQTLATPSISDTFESTEWCTQIIISHAIYPANPHITVATADNNEGGVPSNHKRDQRLYYLSLNPDSTWGMIAAQVNQEFEGEQLDPNSASMAAKRYQKTNNLLPIPKRKPGRKPNGYSG